MLDFPRWKVWLTIIVIVVCGLLAVPSFLPEKTRDALPSWLRPTVSLGLDLAGGSYLLLEADTKGVAADRLEAMREKVRTAMRNDPRIDIGDISSNGQLSFVVRDIAKVDAARERLLPLAGSGVALTGQRDWDIQVINSTQFVLTQTKAGLDKAIDDAMEAARGVVETRVNKLGTREPTIIRQGPQRIVVQVPGLKDPAALKALIGKTAKLEFKLVNDNADPGDLAKGVIPEDTQLLPYAEGGGGKIAVFSRVALSGDQLVDAAMEFDQQDNQPGVRIEFDGAGTKRFAKLSTENTGKRFAIIVDGEVISAPVFREPILGGVARIDGSFTSDSATQLAIALKSGKLPIALKVVEERTVSAELGADSIRKGVLAGVIGTLALVIFMLITYVRFGVYTTLALVVNAFMIIGIMAVFNATLTLPGIAGFVLTIGAAVDANVLINERIREEQRVRNRNAMASVEFGYKEASRAIFDANITNVISAVIMFWIASYSAGSGPIKGFAVVLGIGIVTSVFTGVTFTRLLVADWLRRNRPKSINI